MLKKVFLVLIALILIGVVYARVSIYPMLSVATGYAAKKMCSCHFIADRDPADIQKTDLGFSPLDMTETVINVQQKSATTSIYGMAEKTAVFREHLGCILIQGKDDYNAQLELPSYELPDDQIWPQGHASSTSSVDGVNYDKINSAIDQAFEPANKTRAVVIIYKDSLIAERYADGFDQDTEILGWSMTKSVTSTLFGLLAKDHRISLNATTQFEEWKNDERKNIKLRHLLNMQSGLAFEEIYDELSDATQMLYNAEDVSSIPINKPVIAPPDSLWYYSSGTTNILSKFLRDQFRSHSDYLKFPHERLFRKIGMSSAYMETDESGNYIGSSYLYATPRDWAKFGLLYLNKGNWYGEQLIDTAWVDFSQSIASQSGGLYGGHFWQNDNHAAYPDVPEDVFSANGFQGQRVWIFPSHDMVVVRMGLAGDDVFDMNGFLRDVLKAQEN